MWEYLLHRFGLKKIIAIMLGTILLAVAIGATTLIAISSNLPQLITVKDYEPLLVTEVYARDGEKIGEFFRERRILVPYDKLPDLLVKAFIAAEDSKFMEHKGLNFIAIFRAFLANLKEGRKVQGASTITQQVARSLLLSPEKTYIRKIREMLLSTRMEEHLSKQDIMYLYLNQIYLGHSAHGVGMASQIYFRKPVEKLSLAEMAILAGLPQAPSKYSPVFYPDKAKGRQKYVLERMLSDGYITEEQFKATVAEPVNVYLREDFQKVAPYYTETVRQLVIKHLGENIVLDKGLRIYTGLDYKRQIAAQDAVENGLRELDKRQGYRGPKKKIEAPEVVNDFLLKTRDTLVDEKSPMRVVQPDGSVFAKPPMDFALAKDEKGNLIAKFPSYLSLNQITDAIVTKVDDKFGLVYVKLAETQGLIDLDTMKWARKPNPQMKSEFEEIKKPSAALAVGDVISVKVTDKQFTSTRLKELLDTMKKDHAKKYKGVKNAPEFVMPADLPKFNEYIEVALEQEPEAEGSLISFGQGSADVISMVGGRNYGKSQFNRAIQALRQTGSAFKAIVYASALDAGYTPVTPLSDSAIVYEEEKIIDEGQETEEIVTQKWKPSNHSKTFGGDILFRNALIQSKNIPTVKVVQDIGVNWVANYSRRLGIFSPLNMDFTLGLGSSAVTLYELTKVFATFGRLGVRIKPVIVHKVLDRDGKELIGKIELDERFKDQIDPIETEIEEKRLAVLGIGPDGKKLASDPKKDKEKDVKDKDPKIAEAQAAEGSTDSPLEKKNTPAFTGDKTKDKTPKIYFKDPDQLMDPSTAYMITNLLEGVIYERGGTGGSARSLGRPAAGKTGTTNGYYDAWFVGYTPQIVTGVWVGYDTEKTLGKGEVGGKAALPIWTEFMKVAHSDLPETNFPTPPNIVFVNIDNDTGRLASASTKDVVKQAFIDGTEPQTSGAKDQEEETNQFYKEDLSE
jgi:penicillin-binding protein 1A